MLCNINKILLGAVNHYLLKRPYTIKLVDSITHTREQIERYLIQGSQLDN